VEQVSPSAKDSFGAKKTASRITSAAKLNLNFGWLVGWMDAAIFVVILRNLWCWFHRILV
jgi:hypothetical protein